MDLEKLVLSYSIDENIKISDLKNKNIPSNLDYSKIGKFMEDNNLNFFVDEKGADYHYRFYNTKSKPYIVYWKWDSQILDKKTIWIVWPRKPSNYWKKVLEELFEYLSDKDIVTISWLAPWIDSWVAEHSIKNNIPTIAVLWWWLWYYLYSNKRNFIQKIIDNWWLVMSEFKLKSKPTNFTFPQRNRIIAGLSDLLFLPEAWDGSGSLITVDFALKSNVPVYATPWRIFDTQSEWVNQLIKDKKIGLVSGIKSFVEDNFWKIQEKSKPNISNLSTEEKKIYHFVFEHNWCSYQEIANWVDLDSSEILVVLSSLELQWLIKEELPDSWVVV